MKPSETRECDLAPLFAETLRKGDAVRFRAEGQSMHPFIQAGDIVVVAPVPPAPLLRPGDVLLYETKPHVLRLHRLQRRCRPTGMSAMLTLRGDAPGQNAERIDASRILGVLVSVERAGRILPMRNFLRRNLGLWWPRLRNRLRFLHEPRLPRQRHALSPRQPADPYAFEIVRHALVDTLRSRRPTSPAPDAGFNPNALVSTARRHGVLALCAEALIRSCPTAEADIRLTLFAMALESEKSQACVAEALQALHAAGISPLIVKGPALAALAYDNPLVRPYDDVDLLLDGPCRAGALEVLQRIGWRDSRNTPPLAQHHLLRTTEDLSFINSRCGVGLDIVHPGGILRDAAPVAESPRCPFEIQGARASAPAKTEHFLYCAAHGSKHGWTRLIWLADLDRLSHTFTTHEWTEVLALARERHLTRILALSLMMLKDLLDTPLPPEVTSACAAASAHVVRQQNACLDAQRLGTRHVETWRWWMALQDTSWQRLHYFRVWLFQPTGADLRSALLPLWARSAYAVLRPLRLLMRLVLRRPSPKLTW